MTCSKPDTMSSQNVRVHLPTPSPPCPVAGHRHTWRYGAVQCRTPPPPPPAQNMIGITAAPHPQALIGELWSRS